MNSNEKKAFQLGMPHGTANGKLHKALLFSFIKQLNKDNCFKCGEKILSERELSVEHKVPYLDSEDPVKLFFDLDNIAFSHLSCNCASARPVRHKYKKSESGYKGVLMPADRNLYYRAKLDKIYGGFNSALEAALFYDKKATELFGEEALTNKKLGLLNIDA